MIYYFAMNLGLTGFSWLPPAWVSHGVQTGWGWGNSEGSFPASGLERLRELEAAMPGLHQTLLPFL